MTWAEFQIRAYGWKRQDERESYKFRKVGFAAMWSFHGDFKRMPKNENKYWQIGERPPLNDRQIKAMKKAQKEYFEQLKAQKENGNG